jgi:hypothetical protein
MVPPKGTRYIFLPKDASQAQAVITGITQGDAVQMNQANEEVTVTAASAGRSETVTVTTGPPYQKRRMAQLRFSVRRSIVH